jgi:hypothetical protein
MEQIMALLGVLVALLATDSTRATAVDSVERAMKAYCEKNHIDRDKVEACKLYLIPGTQTFRYELPPVPHETLYKALSARYAFLFIDGKSGKLIEVKATKYDHSIRESTRVLFTAMKEAGVKVKNDDEATRVMRTLIYLDIATQSVEFKLEGTSLIQSNGLYRKQPGTFGGGVFCWTGGDDVGLKVDKDGFVIDLLGGHVR